MNKLETIRDLMTKNPHTMKADDTVAKAAKVMHDKAIGDVLIEDAGELCGIATDRDIVVRVVAQGKNPENVKLREMCTKKVVTAAPDTPVDKVMESMSMLAIRRIPVVDRGKPIGIVSLGDLAIARDRKSVLGTISAAGATR